MKKLTLSLLLVGAFLFGQPADAQVRFGMKAGINASSVKIQGVDDLDPLLGYQGSLVADIGLSSRFFIQPALSFVTKGFGIELEYRDTKGGLTSTGRGTFRTNYLEAPVLLLCKAKIGTSCKIFGGIGPYAAMGINGKSDFGGGSPIQNIVFKPKVNRPEGTYNRMDYGLTSAAGIEMGRVSLAVNYNHGLTNIAPSYRMIDPWVFRNRNLSLTAGYWFGKSQ